MIMVNNLCKRLNKGLALLLAILFLAGQTPVLADPEGVSGQATQIATKSAFSENSKKVNDSNDSYQTFNDFLSNNKTLSQISSFENKVKALIGSVVDGSAKGIKIKDGNISVVVALNNISTKNNAFLQNAAGSIQEAAQTSRVVLTLNSDATAIKEANFDDNGIHYSVSFEQGKISQVVVSNPADALDLGKNYRLVYNADSEEYIYDNYQNDGSIRSRVKNQGLVTTVTQYGDDTEESRFRTITITKEATSGDLTIHSELQFDKDPAMREFDVTIKRGDINLTFDTSFGEYTQALTGYTNFYTFLNVQLNDVVVEIGSRQYFLELFRQQTGLEVTLNDLKNNIKMVESRGPNGEVTTYAWFKYQDYSLILRCNTKDGNFLEAIPLNIVFDRNNNGKIDGREEAQADKLIEMAEAAMSNGEILDYAAYFRSIDAASTPSYRKLRRYARHAVEHGRYRIKYSDFSNRERNAHRRR